MTLCRALLIALLLVCCGSTAGCQHGRFGTTKWFQPAPPVAFTAPPTADEIVRVVNSNSAPVRQLSADSASLTVAGYPPLRANLALERPRRLRLQASLITSELDLGSNDELFWVWIKQSPQPAVFYARHEAFARSSLRQQLPIEPLWVTESLGLVQLDPLASYEGPTAGPQGELMLRTRVESPQGPVIRSYVVHPQYGWLLQQHVHDLRGQLLASAQASQFRYDPTTGVSLPLHVDLSVPSADLKLAINVSGYQINQPVGNPDLMWSLPRLDGYPLVDLLDPAGPYAAPNSPAAAPASFGTATPSSGLPNPTVPPTDGQGLRSAPAPLGGTGPGLSRLPTYTPEPPPDEQMPRYRGYSQPWR